MYHEGNLFCIVLCCFLSTFCDISENCTFFTLQSTILHQKDISQCAPRIISHFATAKYFTIFHKKLFHKKKKGSEEPFFVLSCYAYAPTTTMVGSCIAGVKVTSISQTYCRTKVTSAVLTSPLLFTSAAISLKAAS